MKEPKRESLRPKMGEELAEEKFRACGVLKGKQEERYLGGYSGEASR